MLTLGPQKTIKKQTIIQHTKQVTFWVPKAKKFIPQNNTE